MFTSLLILVVLLASGLIHNPVILTIACVVMPLAAIVWGYELYKGEHGWTLR